MSEARPGPSSGVRRVFISSTNEDLKPHYRAAARDAALDAGFYPTMQEYFVASGEHPPLAACLKKLADADVVVVIVAHRYGWKPPDQPGGLQKSITWLECECARGQGKEVLAFLVDDPEWPAAKKEAYRITEALEQGRATPGLLAEVQQDIARLAEFKKWLDGLGIRSTFTGPEDLRGKVESALRDWRERHFGFGDGPPPKPSAFRQPGFFATPIGSLVFRPQSVDVEDITVGIYSRIQLLKTVPPEGTEPFGVHDSHDYIRRMLDGESFNFVSNRSRNPWCGDDCHRDRSAGVVFGRRLRLEYRLRDEWYQPITATFR